MNYFDMLSELPQIVKFWCCLSISSTIYILVLQFLRYKMNILLCSNWLWKWPFQFLNKILAIGSNIRNGDKYSFLHFIEILPDCELKWIEPKCLKLQTSQWGLLSISTCHMNILLTVACFNYFLFADKILTLVSLNNDSIFRIFKVH